MAFTPNEPETDETKPEIVTLKADHTFAFGTFPKGNKFKVLFYSDDQSYAQVIDAQPDEGQPAVQLYIETSKLKGAKQAKPFEKLPTPPTAAEPAPKPPLVTLEASEDDTTTETEK